MKNIFCVLLGICLALSSAYAVYPEYQQYSHSAIKGGGNYLRYMSPVKKHHIKTIFEIGSRDAIDAIQLSDFFQCHVYAFECNLTAVEICRKNIGFNPNVTLVPSGVWDATGEMAFFWCRFNLS